MSEHLRTCPFNTPAEPRSQPIRLPGFAPVSTNRDEVAATLTRMYPEFDQSEMEEEERSCAAGGGGLFNAQIQANGLTAYQNRLREFAEVAARHRVDDSESEAPDDCSI